LLFRTLCLLAVFQQLNLSLVEIKPFTVWAKIQLNILYEYLMEILVSTLRATHAAFLLFTILNDARISFIEGASFSALSRICSFLLLSQAPSQFRQNSI